MKNIILKLISFFIICTLITFILLYFNLIKESYMALIFSIILIIISLYAIYKTDEQVNRQIKTSEELSSSFLPEACWDRISAVSQQLQPR